MPHGDDRGRDVLEEVASLVTRIEALVSELRRVLDAEPPTDEEGVPGE